MVRVVQRHRLQEGRVQGDEVEDLVGKLAGLRRLLRVRFDVRAHDGRVGGQGRRRPGWRGLETEFLE